jgi:hypothetical protein
MGRRCALGPEAADHLGHYLAENQPLQAPERDARV